MLLRSHRFFLRSLATLTASLIVTSVSFAGLIETGKGLDNVADQSKDIYCGDTLIGDLTINDYYSWTSGSWDGTGPISFSPQYPGGYDPFDSDSADRGGAKVDTTFAASEYLVGCDLRWVQAVVGGTGTIGTPPYLDPFNRDDGLPFYWTADDAQDPNFHDIPSQSIANSGNSIEFEAAFVAVNTTTMQVKWLAGFTWGYSLGDNNVNLDDFAWTTGASNTLQGLVTAWDGSNTPPNYLGDGNPDGWTWTNNCLCETIPEASTTTMLCIGSVVFGGFMTRRRWFSVSA